VPLQPYMELISTDDHLIEHAGVFADRLPSKYRDVGPRIVEMPREDGGAPSQVWQYEDRVYKYIGLNAMAGKKPEEYGTEPVRFDEMIPGCHLASGARGRERVLAQGDMEDGLWWAGRSQGLIDDVRSCAEVVADIVSEAEQIIGTRLPALLADGPNVG
jgi:NAD(P)H-dependent flavin oxidoreductase YrpB (nitropropane dioxygenase family)